MLPLRFRLCLLLAAALSAPAAHAQPLAVRAWVDESTVGVDDLVTYHLQIEGERFGAVQTPEAPATQGLALVQPYPSTQRSASITNGLVRQSLQFSWRFRPTRPGTARIEAATLQVGNEIYTADALTVHVVAGSRSGAARAAPAPDRQTPEAAGLGPRDVFIEVSPSKTSAFQNEQVLVTYRLLFRPGFQFRQLRLADSWDAEGFWREEIDVDANPIPETVVRDGERYASIVLKRAALFATRSGALAVDPLRVEADVYVPRRSRDPFDLFGMRGSLETTRLASPPLRLTITPLPEGAPDSFRGAVGRFRMTTSVDRTALEVGESARLDVQISGAGNLATLVPPTVRAPGAIEVYSPTGEADIARAPAGISGSRDFGYVLVPRARGTFEIPAVAFSYFDPATLRYQTLSGDALALVVTGEAAASADADALPADAIAGIVRAPGRWIRAARPLHRQAWPYAALASPLLALGALAAFRTRQRRRARQAVALRSRSAHPLARKHLRRASEHLARHEARPYYNALHDALLGFLGARLARPERGFTRATLAAALEERGVEAGHVARLLALLDRAEAVRFAPVVPPFEQQERDRDEAAALLVLLDQQMPAR